MKKQPCQFNRMHIFVYRLSDDDKDGLVDEDCAKPLPSKSYLSAIVLRHYHVRVNSLRLC